MLLIFNFYLEKYFKNDIFINYTCANYNKHWCFSIILL